MTEDSLSILREAIEDVGLAPSDCAEGVNNVAVGVTERVPGRSGVVVATLSVVRYTRPSYRLSPSVVSLRLASFLKDRPDIVAKLDLLVLALRVQGVEVCDRNRRSVIERGERP